MGNNNSHLQECVKAAEITRISRKIDEKKCTFIIFQAETIKAISTRNHQNMKSLVPELITHIEDLHYLKQLDLPNTERERCLTLIYNFEVLLVRLRSLLRSGKRNQPQENTGPDIVVDIIHLGGGRIVHNSSQNIEEYFKLDTDIIHLQDQLQNTRFSSNDPLNIKKSRMVTELKEFQSLLNKKTKVLEEQREIGHQISTLRQLAEGSTETELKELGIRALKIQETIKTSSWDHYFMAKKAELLKKISEILENLCTENKSQVNDDTGEDDGELIYENLAVTKNLHREDHTSMLINKSPLPLPRNPDDKVINDLATQWQRLNEILDKESLNEIDKLEIEKIGQSAELAKKLFEKKVAGVVERREERS